MKVLLLQVLVTLTLLKSAFAVYCYDCSSVVDSRCGEAFKPFPKAIVNCDDKPLDIQGVTHNATFCRKLIQSSKAKSIESVIGAVQTVYF